MSGQITINDRREPNPNIVPLVERRGGESARIPAWRRRALEQRDRHGNIAVADLTGKAAS